MNQLRALECRVKESRNMD